MNNRELILSSIQIIENNLRSKISVLDISKELGFSFYYYCRLFKSITGYSPKSYMLARKITESIKELIETDKRIIDLALEFGFGSSEAYTRAFYKIINKNPSEIRKEGNINRQLLLEPISDDKLKKIEHALDKEPEVASLGEIKLVGIPFYHDLSMANDMKSGFLQLTISYQVILILSIMGMSI
ncbi:AraC family transcriptional regulator [Herbivorax sp. ANBcel31]|uniref:helix-turn-helix transcriptional regulator n=1 Tax=Herbivorax sp. ANBcel31 TaxID=3069754 RepID=UPI0027B24C67|nr:AraC family transcriptional regulator [Herbivorax sp. ANBcel31]MDQ2085564.1 AraC family transcriptional regulator [Herbivorax sp. ANBcel31]